MLGIPTFDTTAHYSLDRFKESLRGLSLPDDLSLYRYVGGFDPRTNDYYDPSYQDDFRAIFGYYPEPGVGICPDLVTVCLCGEDTLQINVYIQYTGLDHPIYSKSGEGRLIAIGSTCKKKFVTNRCTKCDRLQRKSATDKDRFIHAICRDCREAIKSVKKLKNSLLEEIDTRVELVPEYQEAQIRDEARRRKEIHLEQLRKSKLGRFEAYRQDAYFQKVEVDVTKFDFGKHNGKTIQEVYDEDKSYFKYVLSIPGRERIKREIWAFLKIKRRDILRHKYRERLNKFPSEIIMALKNSDVWKDEYMLWARPEEWNMLSSLFD